MANRIKLDKNTPIVAMPAEEGQKPTGIPLVEELITYRITGYKGGRRTQQVVAPGRELAIEVCQRMRFVANERGLVYDQVVVELEVATIRRETIFDSAKEGEKPAAKEGDKDGK